VRRATGPIFSTLIVKKRPVMGSGPHRVTVMVIASQHGCSGRAIPVGKPRHGDWMAD
jgi:hypothetical protein